MYVTFQYQRSTMTIASESGQQKVREEEQGKYSTGLDIYSTAYITIYMQHVDIFTWLFGISHANSWLST